MNMGTNFGLLYSIPQDSHQIWDEASKTSVNFSILRNTRLQVFDSSLINNHASLPGYKSRGVFLTQKVIHFRSSSKLVSGIQSFTLCGKIRAKLYMDFTYLIAACIRQNRIHNSLLDETLDISHPGFDDRK